MRKTRFILFVLAFMMFGVMNAEIASGTCGKDGDNITWVLDDDGTLTLSGSGEMEDYEYSYSPNTPWYSNREKIIKVSISEGITSVGDYAFYECSGLTSVTIPNSVSNIGMYAFHGCSGLTSVTIPNSVTSISFAAFSGCSGLTSVTIPNSVTVIYGQTFGGCSGLTSVTIPNSVTSIMWGAFYGCSGLTSVTIGNSVTSIEDEVFAACSGLTSVTIPNSVTSIGNHVFEGCSSLTFLEVDSSNPNYCSMDNVIFNKEKTELTICAGGKAGTYNIPNTVTSINEGAFTGCSGLTSVDIPNSVTSIGNGAFCGCSGLTSVTIPNSVTKIIEKTFSGCGNITTIHYNSNALYKFESPVVEVYYGDEITSVYPISSELSSLTKVVLGKNVGNLQTGAFKDANLKEFYITGEKNIYLGQNVFQNVEVSNATLYVPESRIEFYKATAPWFGFGKIVDLDGNEMPDTTKEQCANPTIAYSNGKLIYYTKTEGAEIVSKVMVDDAKTSYGFEVPLTATYNITAYATKNGYDDSEVVTATLVWIDAQLTTDAPTDVQAVKARPVLVSSNDGNVTITGLEDNETVDVYSLSGAKLNTVKSVFGAASFNDEKGNIVIVKIGDRSIKVVVK